MSADAGSLDLAKGVTKLSNISDINFTSLGDNELIQYNLSNSEWENKTVGEALVAGDIDLGTSYLSLVVNADDKGIALRNGDQSNEALVAIYRNAGAREGRISVYYQGVQKINLSGNQESFFENSLKAKGAFTVQNANGINIGSGADADQDLITVAVTGAPKLYWDESADAFRHDGSFIIQDARVTNALHFTQTANNNRIAPSGTGARLYAADGNPKIVYDNTGIVFFGGTTVAQPTTGIAEATFVENSGGTVVNIDSTFGGYTLQQIAQALQDLGLLA